MCSSHHAVKAAWGIQKLNKLNRWLLFDMGGGPRPFKLAWVINLQKGGSFPFFALLIWYYADKTPAATSDASWIYLALHGSYGMTWLMKDLFFPDANWQGRATLPSCLFGVVGLAAYWLAGWLVISGTSTLNYPLADGPWFSLCISMCLLGCIIMTAADIQKFCTLKLKRGLITDGMFKYIRHPNYLGEMMIYGALALLAWHWIPFLVLAFFWGTQFVTNMAMKEVSMSRYSEWAEYKKRSWWLIPRII